MPATWVWKKCPKCGKRFEVYDNQWGYKTHDKHERYFCSWHCLRATETGEQAKKGKSRTEKEEAISRMIAKGASTREIMRTLNIAKSTVSYYRARVVTEEDAV